MRLLRGTYRAQYEVTCSLGAVSRLRAADVASDLASRLNGTGFASLVSEEGSPSIDGTQRVANGGKVTVVFKFECSAPGDSINIDRAVFTALQQNGWQGTSVNFFVDKLPLNGGTGVLNTRNVILGGVLGAFGLGAGAAIGAGIGVNTGDFRTVASTIQAIPAGTVIRRPEPDALDRALGVRTVTSNDPTSIGQPTPPVIPPLGDRPLFELDTTTKLALGVVGGTVVLVGVAYFVRAVK